MRRLVLTLCLLLATVFCGRTIRAQESSQAPPPAKAAEAPAHFFHLLFVVQEVGPDGKPTNSRSYTATVSTDPRERDHHPHQLQDSDCHRLVFDRRKEYAMAVHQRRCEHRC